MQDHLDPLVILSMPKRMVAKVISKLRFISGFQIFPETGAWGVFIIFLLLYILTKSSLPNRKLLHSFEQLKKQILLSNRFLAFTSTVVPAI